MAMSFEWFERVVRSAPTPPLARPDAEIQAPPLHPFDVRNVHANLPNRVRKLFDDGHYAEATFCAFKHVDNAVKRHSGIKSKTGEKLMLEAFNPDDPKIILNDLSGPSEVDEQRGFRFIFAGGVVGIRNPRGHEIETDDVEVCLDHLAFASMLLRRLEQAGYT